jgi:hypothetical protein
LIVNVFRRWLGWPERQRAPDLAEKKFLLNLFLVFKEGPMNDKPETTSHSLPPGGKISLRCKTDGCGFEILSSDGMSVRFNLVGGNSASITAGTSKITINLNGPYDDLIGLPE